MKTTRNLMLVLAVVCSCYAQAENAPIATNDTLNRMAEAARVYLGLPPLEILPADQLKLVLEFWDQTATSNDLRDRDDAVHSVSKGAVLRYGNTEIMDRVVELYISEIDADTRRAKDGVLSLADEGITGSGEMHQDYMDRLTPVAHLTFSPRIHDRVLSSYDRGGFENVYLAVIKPVNTLQLLLETHRRSRECLSQGANWLDHPTGQAYFHSIDDGLQVLALLCELSPKVVDARRAEVIDFVGKHATFYRTPVKVGPNDEPKLHPVFDFRTRDRALRILELLGTPEDIPLVEDIMLEPPLTPEQVTRGETISGITVRGEQLLQRLRTTP